MMVELREGFKRKEINMRQRLAENAQVWFIPVWNEGKVSHTIGFRYIAVQKIWYRLLHGHREQMTSIFA